MLIITLLLILKPYATIWQITLVKYLAIQQKTISMIALSHIWMKRYPNSRKNNNLRWRIQYTRFFSKTKRKVPTYLSTKRAGWIVYSRNTINMVAHISSFAWHASIRLLLTTVSLVNVHVCIFKGHNKSRLNSDSYRGITLLSVIFKIFESVLDSLMPQLEATAVYPNSHQCGF